MARAHHTGELKLPTTTVGVRLALVGSTPADVEMFVPDVARHGRAQLCDDVAAQLAGGARFLPVRGAGAIRLVAKHAIIWVAVARFGSGDTTQDEPIEPGDELALYDHQHLVEVELAVGERLTGTLFDSAPADRARLIDHLNRTDAFLRLWTTDQHYVISAAQVVAVTELGEVWG